MVQARSVLGFVTIALGLCCVQCGTCNPRPVLTAISPNHATAGGSGFVLTVSGDDFVPGAQVIWNGTQLTTTFVNGHELTAVVPASEIAVPGTVNVLVFNPAGSNTVVFGFNANHGCGGNSGSLSFTVVS